MASTEEQTRKLARIRGWLRSLNDELEGVELALAANLDRAEEMLDDLYEALGPMWADDSGDYDD